MSDTNYKLLRQFIREEAARIGGAGSRNIATVDPTPITWDKLPGYDVEISPKVDEGYSLTVYYQGKKLGYSKEFNDYDEAMHYARMVVDKHRIT